MPQLILEYSTNVIETENLADLFQQIHCRLAELMQLPVTAFLSSAIQHNGYCRADDTNNSALVQLTCKLMRGRTHDALLNIGQTILDMTKIYFVESAKKFELRISLEIIELQRTPLKEGVSISNQLPTSICM